MAGTAAGIATIDLTATEHCIAFVSIDKEAQPKDVKDIVSKLCCTVFLNCASLEFVNGQWQFDKEGTTMFLQKVVPDGFSADIKGSLAMMWPTTEGSKLKGSLDWLSTQWHTSASGRLQPTGTHVCNVAIGKVDVAPGLACVLKECKKEPFIIGGCIEANEHMLTYYLTGHSIPGIRVVTSTSQFPSCKCILNCPGIGVSVVTSMANKYENINVIMLTLESKDTPESAASSSQGQQRIDRSKWPRAIEPGQEERQMCQSQEPGQGEQSLVAPVNPQPKKRRRATEPDQREHPQLECFGALGHGDFEDVFVALIGTLLKHACPLLSTMALEKATRLAVQENNSSDCPVIRELAQYVLFDKQGVLKDVAEVIEEWNNLMTQRDAVLQYRSSRQAHRNCWSLLGDQDPNLNENEVGCCREAWHKEFFRWSLTLEQQEDSRYTSVDNVSLQFQNFFCDCMIRKYTGHKCIATSIWQTGLPCARLSREGLRASRSVNKVASVQSDIKDLIKFFTAIGTKLRERRATALYAEAVRRSGSYRCSGNNADDRFRKQPRMGPFRI